MYGHTYTPVRATFAIVDNAILLLPLFIAHCLLPHSCVHRMPSTVVPSA